MHIINVLASRRLRRSTFFERVNAAGATTYTIYNHMLLPAMFESIIADYKHLKKYVQIWDVSVQRQVQIKGRDARKLVVMMTPRDLRRALPGRCYYAPITDNNGRLINDPIVLCLTDNLFWLSIADSDVLLWTKALATALKLDVEINEPDISPLAIQGPLAENLMVDAFGTKIGDIKFFRFATFSFQGRRLNIARSGWSKQSGFEIYLDDSTLAIDLWDYIMDKGKPYNLRAGCPNLIERIESGLLSYGNDMTNADTPLEVGLDAFCHLDSGHGFIGKAALLAQMKAGIRRKLVGLKINGTPIDPLVAPVLCFDNDRKVGFCTSGIYSPCLASNICLAMLDINYSKIGQQLDINLQNQKRTASVCRIPFIT